MVNFYVAKAAAFMELWHWGIFTSSLSPKRVHVSLRIERDLKRWDCCTHFMDGYETFEHFETVERGSGFLLDIHTRLTWARPWEIQANFHTKININCNSIHYNHPFRDVGSVPSRSYDRL